MSFDSQGILTNTLNFDQICRTCLCERELRCIFGENEEVMLLEMLTICTSLVVTENDELPAKICRQCMEELHRSFKFRQRCKISEEHLYYYLKRAEHRIIRNGSYEKITLKTELPDQEQIIICDDTEINLSSSKINPKNVVCDEQVTEGGNEDRKSDYHEISHENEDINVISEENHESKFEEQRDINHEIINQSNHDMHQANIDKKEKKKKKKSKVKKKKSYRCKPCDEIFDTADKLSEHRKSVKHPSKRNHTCSICSKKFTHSHLNIHMRSHTAEKPFRCKICGQTFSLNCNLQRHLHIHSGKKPFKCNVCEKSFTQGSSLTQHLQMHNGKEKSHLCSSCGKGFTSMGALKSHSKIHTGIRPHSCLICKKSFTHIGTLKSHMLIHTGQKPFICTVCGKAFTQRNHLKYHLRTHSGEKPFSCAVCAKTFSLKGNLTVHMRTHTGETPYCCTTCRKGFYDSSSMKKHNKGHVDNEGQKCVT